MALVYLWMLAINFFQPPENSELFRKTHYLGDSPLKTCPRTAVLASHLRAHEEKSLVYSCWYKQSQCWHPLCNISRDAAVATALRGLASHLGAHEGKALSCSCWYKQSQHWHPLCNISRDAAVATALPEQLHWLPTSEHVKETHSHVAGDINSPSIDILSAIFLEMLQWLQPFWNSCTGSPPQSMWRKLTCSWWYKQSQRWHPLYNIFRDAAVATALRALASHLREHEEKLLPCSCCYKQSWCWYPLHYFQRRSSGYSPPWKGQHFQPGGSTWRWLLARRWWCSVALVSSVRKLCSVSSSSPTPSSSAQVRVAHRCAYTHMHTHEHVLKY